MARIKNGNNRKKPGTPISEYSITMLEKWQNPEYRKRMSDLARERWNDPEYRKKHMSKLVRSKQIKNQLTATEHYRSTAKEMIRYADKLIKMAEVVERHAGIMEGSSFREFRTIMVKGNVEVLYRTPENEKYGIDNVAPSGE